MSWHGDLIMIRSQNGGVSLHDHDRDDNDLVDSTTVDILNKFYFAEAEENIFLCTDTQPK